MASLMTAIGLYTLSESDGCTAALAASPHPCKHVGPAAMSRRSAWQELQHTANAKLAVGTKHTPGTNCRAIVPQTPTHSRREPARAEDMLDRPCSRWHMLSN